MICAGACECGIVRVNVAVDENARHIHPRVCDCDYCKRNPSAVISHPSMVIELLGNINDLKIEQNGDGLAGFYRCPCCDSLIVVACEISGAVRGAVNVDLLECADSFGERMNISPKSLTAHEKLERWENLWGTIRESA